MAASGLDKGRPLHANLRVDEESGVIAQTLRTLRAASGDAVIGWHSPSHSQSAATYDLLAAHGVEYAMDWVNDDLPYEVRVAEGTMHALPLSEQWADNNVFAAQHHPPEEWIDGHVDAVAGERDCEGRANPLLRSGDQRSSGCGHRHPPGRDSSVQPTRCAAA